MARGKPMSRAPSEAGFSLVEALVALAVFAMAGVGLVQLQTHSLQTLSRVETRALAELVAQNALVDIMAARDKPGLGARSDELRFAGRDWRVSIAVTATPDPVMRRVSVAAREAGAQAPPVETHAFIAVAPGAPS